MKIDPILLSVYARTFKSITDEMSISMQQTTRSPILCEAKDFVTGVYDADGRMLEQTENLPILAFSLAPVCKYIKDYFGDETANEDPSPFLPFGSIDLHPAATSIQVSRVTSKNRR